MKKELKEKFEDLISKYHPAIRKDEFAYAACLDLMFYSMGLSKSEDAERIKELEDCLRLVRGMCNSELMPTERQLSNLSELIANSLTPPNGL